MFGGEMIPTDKTLSYKDLQKYKVSQIMWVHTQMYPYNKDTNGTGKNVLISGVPLRSRLFLGIDHHSGVSLFLRERFPCNFHIIDAMFLDNRPTQEWWRRTWRELERLCRRSRDMWWSSHFISWRRKTSRPTLTIWSTLPLTLWSSSNSSLHEQLES